MYDDQFTAKGPPNAGSGFPDSGFSTDAGSDSPAFQFGVHAHALRYGVMGQTVEAVAGVYGHGDPNFGVLGTAFGEGSIAILGASVIDTNDLMNTNVPPGDIKLQLGHGEGVVGQSDSSNGVRGQSASGTGVVGGSHTGTGVYGHSEQATGVHGEGSTGSGVYGHSISAIGVAGVSKHGLGGQFQSADRGQIRLVPRRVEWGTGDRGDYPKLPSSGESGEMITVAHKVPFEPDAEGEECSLWLCVRSSGILVGAALWAQVQLGSAIIGEG